MSGKTLPESRVTAGACCDDAWHIAHDHMSALCHGGGCRLKGWPRKRCYAETCTCPCHERNRQ